MAQKVVVEITDDLDGGKAVETVTFGLDSRSYMIDLSAKNARALRKILGPYVESGRRIRTGRPDRARHVRSAGARTTATTQDVRVWARAQGIEVADRGRIPRDLTVKFQAAHSS